MPNVEFTSWWLLAEGEGGGILDQLFGSMLFPLIIVGIVAYFMLLLPERRHREKLKEQQASLKKNDKVIIAGGIYGVVVDAAKEGDRVKVRIDEKTGTSVSIMRTSILQILDDESKTNESKPDPKEESDSDSK